VTTVAVLSSVLEGAVHMARRARGCDMYARQRERRRAVIKFRPPAEGIDFVTFFAIRTKASERVTGLLGILIIRAVAAIA
jgi:hypothetical protein